MKSKMGREPGEQLGGRASLGILCLQSHNSRYSKWNYAGTLPIRLCRGTMKLTGAWRAQDAAIIPL